MRETVSIILIAMLVSPETWAQPPGRTLKEQVLNIAPGSPVEVRLADNSKLRGRLGPVMDTAFELQTVKGGKVDTENITFDQF
jgi:hypothetical protein